MKDLPVSNINMFIEILAAGVSRSQPYYSHSLTVQVIENYGQLKVSQKKTGAPVPGTYVKVYAQMSSGGESSAEHGPH